MSNFNFYRVGGDIKMAYIKRVTIKKTLNKSLAYIENNEKTEGGILVYGLNCSINSKVAYKQMQHTRSTMVRKMVIKVITLYKVSNPKK